GAGKGPGTPVRRRGPVLEPRRPLVTEPAEPLVHRGCRHRGGLRRLSDRPAVDQDAFHEHATPVRRELRPTMGHESLLPARSLFNPEPCREALLRSTTLVGTTPSRRRRPLWARCRPPPRRRGARRGRPAPCR